MANAMHIKTLVAGLAMATISAISAARQIPLDIGAQAPRLTPEVWIKGTPVDQFQKGQVYVLVFWSIGFSPYTPWISHLTDKMKANVHFISINTFDQPPNRPEVAEAHRLRVENYLEGAKAEFPYSICIDDAKNSLALSWIPNTGGSKTPRVAIVDQRGELAWMGHPMAMEGPLVKICRNAYDRGSFKRQFDDSAEKFLTHVQLCKDIVEAAKADNETLVEGLTRKIDGPRSYAMQTAIYQASKGNPEFALAYLKKVRSRTDELWLSSYCNLLFQIVLASKVDATREEAARLSAKFVSECSDWEIAIAETWHARTLAALGKRDQAIFMINKAREDVSKYHPQLQRGELYMMVDNARATIK